AWMSAMTTLAPSVWKRRTVASPIPLAPPVIAATRPRRRWVMVSSESGADSDGHGFQVGVETFGAHLPADAGLFETAERRVGGLGPTVDADHAGAHPPGDRQRAFLVAAPHRSGQAVDRVVGDSDRLVVPVVFDDGEHGPEDLLLGDAHRVVHFGEQGGGDEPAARQLRRQGGPLAADNDPGAFLASGGGAAVAALLRASAHHGADPRGRVDRVAGPLRSHAWGARVNERVFAGAGDEQPGLGDAGLAVDHERH